MVSRRYRQSQQVAQRVDRDVNPSNPCAALGCGLQRSAVDTDRRGLAFAPGPHAHDRLHIGHQRLEHTRIQPAPELLIDRSPRRQIARNHPPRALSRHLAALTEDHAWLRSRSHAANGSATTPRCVREDLKRSLNALSKRILRLRREAVALCRQDAELARKFKQLVGIPGIGETSAVQLLAELASLDPEMTVRQWVALSGLDPAHQMSGTSVHRRSRISRRGNRHLRRAHFMPALVGVRANPYLKAFYLALQARHKTKMQALIAVARKLLHAIYGIFKTNQPFEGAKLFPATHTHF